MTAVPATLDLMKRSLWAAAAVLVIACGDDSTRFDAGVDGGGSDATASFTLRVDPPTDSETVTIGLQNKTVQFHAYRRDSPTAQEVDVTSLVTWNIADPLVATPSSGGAYTLQGVGGVTKVDAALQGVHGTADLTVKATGNAFLGGTDPSAVQTFSNATPDTNAADAPTLEYPLDGVVFPGNMPPIDFQWSQAADNDLYRVHITTPSTLDVYLYTSALDAVASTATWTPLVESARDTAATWTVEATGPSNPCGRRRRAR